MPPFFPTYEFMRLASPFDRKRVLMYIDSFIKLNYGSYFELIQLTLRDLAELGIAIESKAKEEQIAQAI